MKKQKYNTREVLNEIKRICRNIDSTNPCEVNLCLLEIIDWCNEIKLKKSI